MFDWDVVLGRRLERFGGSFWKFVEDMVMLPHLLFQSMGMDDLNLLQDNGIQFAKGRPRLKTERNGSRKDDSIVDFPCILDEYSMESYELM